MHYAQIFVLLLVFVAGLGLLARRWQIPYPILFVLGGLLIAFVPGLPRLHLDPDFIFFIFLPPLLYIQAFFTSWRDFMRHLRAILLLAIGLVLATTVTVAFVAHACIPGFSLAAAFVLGAIISPPDAVAASAIANQMGLPRAVVTVLECESLCNDATGLVAFNLALTATAATYMIMAPGPFAGWLAWHLVYVSLGGIAIGLLVGKAVAWTRLRLLNDGPQLMLTVSLLTPFASYLLAEPFHVSGVLAVVTTGLYLGGSASEIITASTRLQALAFWDMIIYLLNGTVFVLIGLQLPEIMRGITGVSGSTLFLDAAIVNLTCIAVRLLWVFPGAYLPRLFSRTIRRSEPRPDAREVFIVGWAGMRGVVSLAATLTLSSGAPFPGARLVQFLACTVILTTLVVQGLTLPAIIRFLGVSVDDSEEQEEKVARRRLSRVALEKLEATRAEKKFKPEVVETIEKIYRDRALQLEDALADELGWSEHRHYTLSVHQLRKKVVEMERQTLHALRRSGEISDGVMHKIEHELDLEEARLRL